MSTTQKFFIGLAIIVIGFYLGLTYLPQIIGTCMDGECGFSIGELVVSFALPLTFITLPIVLEMAFYRKGLVQALNDTGITRLSWTGIRLAVIYGLPLMTLFPVLALITNSPVTIRPNWEWLLVNIILVNGFAEEIMMRGFVFRHLRNGRPFWRAAMLSTIYFAGYHLPIILSSGLVIGVIAVIIAIPLGFLTAYVYERDHNSIWGPGLLHVINNGLVMLLVFPKDVQPVASSLYMLFGIVVSTLMLVQAYRAGFGRTTTRALSEPVAVTA